MRPTGFGGCFASVKAPIRGFCSENQAQYPVGSLNETGMGTPFPESSPFTAGSMSRS